MRNPLNVKKTEKGKVILLFGTKIPVRNKTHQKLVNPRCGFENVKGKN